MPFIVSQFVFVKGLHYENFLRNVLSCIKCNHDHGMLRNNSVVRSFVFIRMIMVAHHSNTGVISIHSRVRWGQYTNLRTICQYV